jgi:hypothetical protein
MVGPELAESCSKIMDWTLRPTRLGQLVGDQLVNMRRTSWPGTGALD